jgi:drug/metabolite transporter (DMT)-like permease
LAERRVPSGIAAVMMATIPVFMALAEIVFLRAQRLIVRLGLAPLAGVGGVAVLVGHTMSLGEAPAGTSLFLCSKTRRLRSPVTRVYKT